MRNWKTTLFGALVLAAQIGGPFVPGYKGALDTATEILVGVGLVAAADATRKERRDR